jgi:O-antigen/teichoic acid export membrane protein
MFSPAMLGFYSRAESLKSQVQTYTTNSLRKVIFPVLSQLQDDDEKFKSTYFKAFNIVTGLIVLLIAPIYFLSNFIIIFLLGAKWEPSIIFFQILIFSAITSPQIGMMGKAVLAKGYSKLKFNIGLIQRLLKTTPIVFGLLFGIKEFAIAVVAASTLVFFVYSIVLDKRMQLSFWFQVKNLLIPNLVFFCFLIFSLLFEKNVNQWLITILFLITHVIYIKLIKHESYTFMQAALKKGISILKKKFSK